MTPQVQRADALPAGSRLQSYTIQKVIGSGAFGITYLAEHVHLGSLHVIKEYFPDSGVRLDGVNVAAKSSSDQDLFDWGLSSFFSEAKLLYGLSHPNIVKVTDLFEANGTAYFVMPYLQGNTLHQWLKEHPKPDEAALGQIFIPLLEGLKYIHERQLLHRDIKPENILMTAGGTPVLIDFGAARQAIGQKSRPLTQILTPPFAPIEQYQSRDVFLPALDLYSLAACIYQAVTGKLIEEAPARIAGEDTQPKLAGSAYERHYSPHFLAAVDYALNVRAEHRFQSAMEMQQALLGLSPSPASVQAANNGQTVAALSPAAHAGKRAATSARPVLVRKKTAKPAAGGKKTGWLAAGAFVVLLCILAFAFSRFRQEAAPAQASEVVVRQNDGQPSSDEHSDPPLQLPGSTGQGEVTGIQITAETVAAMNEDLPKMIDSQAMLERIYYAENSRTLVYQVRFVNFAAGKLNRSELDRLGEMMRDTTCQDPNMRSWIVETASTVLFVFNDKNGKHLIDTAVSRQDCL